MSDSLLRSFKLNFTPLSAPRCSGRIQMQSGDGRVLLLHHHPPNSAQILEDGEVLVSHSKGLRSTEAHLFWVCSALCLRRTSQGLLRQGKFPWLDWAAMESSSVTHTWLFGTALSNGPSHPSSTIRYAVVLPKWSSVPLSFYILCNFSLFTLWYIYWYIVQFANLFLPAFSRKPTECGSPSWHLYPSC